MDFDRGGGSITVPKPTWKGTISFGLVNVPVTLFPIEQHNEIGFHLLDSRDASRVRYQRVNESTGQEVPWDKIVKGYEHADGNYIVLSDDELKSAAPEMNKRIEIEQFVDLKDIEPTYFEKPYVLVPEKGGEKGYVLLRDAMATSERVGIARVVIRSRGYLAALMPHGDALLLELLRFHDELQPIEDYDLPKRKDPHHKVAKKELDLAVQLIDGMASRFEPEGFHDDYRDALSKLIETRIKSGKSVAGPETEEAEVEAPATVNFMDVLKRSLKSKPRRPGPKRTAKARTRRQRAG